MLSLNGRGPLGSRRPQTSACLGVTAEVEDGGDEWAGASPCGIGKHLVAFLRLNRLNQHRAVRDVRDHRSETQGGDSTQTGVISQGMYSLCDSLLDGESENIIIMVPSPS